MEDSINSNVVTIHLQHSPTLLSVNADSISGKTAYSFSLSEETAANENTGSNSNVVLFCFLALLIAFGVWFLYHKKHHKQEKQEPAKNQEANLRYELLKQSEIYKEFVRKGYFSVNGKESLSIIKEKEISSLCETVVSIYQDFPNTLKEKCELSEKDFHFCCLVKSGLTTFELAEIYSVSESAIFKRKQKAKEKLGLQNDKRTLDEILSEI